MYDSSVVEHVHCPQQVSGVASDHVFWQALLGFGPQGTLVAVLHEDIEFSLQRGEGEGGREGGREEGGREGRGREEGMERQRQREGGREGGGEVGGREREGDGKEE